MSTRSDEGTTPYGMIVAWTDPPSDVEDEFNDWYETEHLAERMRVPGFLTCRRLWRESAPRYVATYDLESVAVLDSAAYLNVTGNKRSPWTARMLKKFRSFDRRVYEQVLPGRERINEAHQHVVMRRIPAPSSEVRAQVDGLVAELRGQGEGVTARLFVGRVPAAAEGELLVYCTAADAAGTRRLLEAPLGGEVVEVTGFQRDGVEDDRHTQVPSAPRASFISFYRRGFTDGLPIIPPTQDLVDEMIAEYGQPGDTLLGYLPPRKGPATLEALAVNAVMAGCMPAHFPVVVAAVEAMLEPSFNLLGVQATTHPVTPMLVVNGPIRHELGFNLSGNSMGEGTHANAAIGRAVRLAMRNIGGGRPGKADFTTQGSPARYSFVVAENEEASPFPPLHVARGFAPEDSVVTVFGCEGPHNVNDHSSNCAESLLQMIVGTMATFGSNDLARGGKPTLALGPEHAQMLGREGFTRESVQAYLFEHARVRPEALPKEMRVWLEERQDIDKSLWNARGIPIGSCPEDISIFVTGAKGRHSCHMPSFGFTRPASHRIVFTPTGKPAMVLPECDC